MPLKYLFSATFENGHVITQQPDDVSARDPKKSAFYDVRSFVEQYSPLVSFELREQGNPANTWTVDLTTGTFLHGKLPFAVSDGLDPNEVQNLAGAKREVVFWRRHTHEFRLSDGEELGHGIRYDLGWQANVGGKNYQRLIHFS
jgi:hypothetical protein